MIKPGMFISDRYEIIDKVGSGGMADVYKAKCHRLNRYVAIKILKSEFSSDANFVQKFRAEAQSVAGLSHPNIVSVYDVGDDDGLHYIVMELVEGITLKRFIERKGRLDVKEAVGITIQIAQGMEAAHEHHIVHRDIKPQNIIISREGKVKVADFGIAKAATSNTISQNAIGSVHYLSPEQARGGYSDERSDIYSLGVTLYEMLTGQVPFAGDNSVSVALLHIQSEATPVQVLNPEVSTSVDRIVQKCMQKKQERRYQSASELIKDLKRSIINPDGDYVNISNSAQVTNSPTRSITSDEMATIKSAAKSPAVHIDNSRPVAQQPGKHIKKEEEELDSMPSTLEKVLTIVSVIFAVALMCLIFYLLWQFFFNDKNDNKDNNNNITSEAVSKAPISSAPNKVIPSDPPTPTLSPTPTGLIANKIPMQLVVGTTLEDAQEIIRSMSPDITINYSEEEYSDEYEKGIVCAQYPPKDILIEANGEVRLTISAGKEYIELKDLTNKIFSQAEDILNAQNFKIIPLHEFSDDIDEGYVIRTEPAAGDMVLKESIITVYISDGPENKTVPVPYIIGKAKADASAMLKEVGLSLGKATKVYSDEYPSGTVIDQEILANTEVERGTSINYTLSRGPKKSSSEDSGDNTEPGADGGNTESGDTEPVG